MTGVGMDSLLGNLPGLVSIDPHQISENRCSRSDPSQSLSQRPTLPDTITAPHAVRRAAPAHWSEVNRGPTIYTLQPQDLRVRGIYPCEVDET